MHLHRLHINVWSIVLGSLSALDGIIKGGARKVLRKRIGELVKPVLDRLGYRPTAEESHATRALRGRLLSLLGTIGGEAAVIAELEAMLSEWKANRSSIDGNLLPAIVEVLAYNGSMERYEEFFQLFKDASTPQEEQRFLSSLCGFRNEALLDHTRDLLFSEHVRPQDAPYVFARLLSNEVSSSSAWRFMKANWVQIERAFPASGVRSMIGACSALDTPSLARQVRRFFARRKVRQGEMATAQMLEQLKVNVRLREEQGILLGKHLRRSQKQAPHRGSPQGGGPQSVTVIWSILFLSWRASSGLPNFSYAFALSL